MTAWSNPALVAKTPLVTVVLLENANIQQLWRMWTQHTAAGQSLWGWLSVNLALLLWCNFYRVCCPDQRIAYWATVVGWALNTCVVLTVAYFRYVVRSG